MKIEVKIVKLHPEAKIPFYAYENAAGCDLYSIEDSEIKPSETVLIKTGISVEIPRGYCWQIWDRSGLGVKGIHRFAGIIDSDYRGEIKVVLNNSTKETFKISKEDRIAQALLVQIMPSEFKEVKELEQTKRGEGGSHSSGKK